VTTGVSTPITTQAHDMEGLWKLFLLIAAGVGLLVVGLMLFVILRGRRRDTLPPQTRERILIEVVYTAIPLVVIAGLFTVTLGSVRSIDRIDPAKTDLTVDVVGFQWQWQFTYPDHGIVITGTATTVPELVLPADATVRFDLTSVDVIHSFWIPGFRFKRDLIPGSPTSFQVHIDGQTGRWDNGACAEFCGIDHARMRFSIRIVTPAEFDQWVAAHRP
jgi:cytochrome c oxidase subunit 2